MWEEHPNIGALAGMLLGIHDGFRRASRQLCAQIERDHPLDDLRRAFRPLASTLHHHHQIEERVLFPMVARTTSRFPDELVEDHQLLMGAIDRVERSLEGQGGPGTREALVALDACLSEHLDREETLVIPILLAMDRSEMLRLLSGL